MEMNFSKVDLSAVFPLCEVLDDVIVSKKGDLTFGWRVILPPAYTFDEGEYDDLVGRLSGAARNLPDWTIIHKQDVFTHRKYEPEEATGFLGQSYERHFDGREYLEHESRIFLTFSSKSAMWHTMTDCSIFGIKEFVRKPEWTGLCRSKAKEFETFLGQCDGISLTPITGTELLGDGRNPGMIQSYLMMSEKDMSLSDIRLAPDSVKAFDRKMVCFSATMADQMPSEITSVKEVSTLSTAHSRIVLSTGSMLGIRLDCDHIVNQYVAILPQEMLLKGIETKRRRMKASSTGNIENRRNAEEMEAVQADANGGSLFFVKSHVNVMVWDREERLDEVSGVVKAMMSSMGINAVCNTFDTPVLYFAGLPGGESELHRDDYMTMELESALCPWVYETFDTDSSGGIFKVCDRTRNVPICLETIKSAGNYNAFILGPSGTGKSFVTNFYLRQCYDAGGSIYIVDIGDSYEGLCKVIREESGGRDGLYYKYDRDSPLKLNPFFGYSEVKGGKSGSLMYLEGLLKTIWTPDDGWNDANTPILTEVIRTFMKQYERKKTRPTFNDFDAFVSGPLKKKIEGSEFMCGNTIVMPADFDCDKFSKAMTPFTSKGTYSELLNGTEQIDLSASRFVIFELSSVKDDGKMLSIVTSTIMHEFEEMMTKVKSMKYLVIDEAWKAIANEAMEPKIMELWRTARKFSASAVVVTQDVEDIISSRIIKNVILNNSAMKILLDQSNCQNNFDPIAGLFGLDEKQSAMVLSTMKGVNPAYRYREAYIQIGSKAGVYGIEASPEEMIAYQSNKEAKQAFLDRTEELGSAIAAIKELAGNEK